jgi:hypothetical protein
MSSLSVLTVAILSSYVVLWIISDLRMKIFVDSWAKKNGLLVVKIDRCFSYLGTPFRKERASFNSIRRVCIKDQRGEERWCWIKLSSAFGSLERQLSDRRGHQVIWIA